MKIFIIFGRSSEIFQEIFRRRGLLIDWFERIFELNIFNLGGSKKKSSLNEGIWQRIDTKELV